MSKFLCTLLSMSLGGSLMALLLLLLRPLLHRRGRHTALFYLYLPVLLRLLLPLPGFLPFSLPQTTELTETVTAQDRAPVARPIHVVDDMTAGMGTLEDAATSEPTTGSAERLPYSVDSDAAPVSAPSYSPRFSPDGATIAAAVYFAGVAFAFLYNFLGYARFARAVRRSGTRAPESAYAALAGLCPEGTVGLLCSPAAPVPLLMGLRCPLIVLPPDTVGEDELPDVLRHELTHCRRQDLCYKWLMVLTLCIHWFNPLLYVLRRTMAADCELSCDEDIIRDMNPRERQHYGETLIRLSAHDHLPPSLPAATLSEGKEQLRTRLLSIMHAAPSTSAAVLTWLLCAVILCGCGSIIGSGARREAETPAPGGLTRPLRDEEGRWSTDGDVWYQPGQFVYDNLGRWSTDGNIWYGNGYWTTDGNTLYDYSLYLGERVPLYATNGNVDPSRCEPVAVSTVDELLAALGEYSYITLSPGVYDLSQASVDFYPSVHWKPEGGEQKMLSSDLYSTVIRGATGDSAEVTLLFGSGKNAALTFSRCYGLNFQNLTFSSAAGVDNPGHLLSFEDCSNVYFGNCDFTSNGGAAVHLLNSGFVTLENCSFQRTLQGNVYAENHRVLLCRDCDFTGSGSSLPTLLNSTAVNFQGCTLNGQDMDGDEAYYVYS